MFFFLQKNSPGVFNHWKSNHLGGGRVKERPGLTMVANEAGWAASDGSARGSGGPQGPERVGAGGGRGRRSPAKRQVPSSPTTPPAPQPTSAARQRCEPRSRGIGRRGGGNNGRRIQLVFWVLILECGGLAVVPAPSVGGITQPADIDPKEVPGVFPEFSSVFFWSGFIHSPFEVGSRGFHHLKPLLGILATQIFLWECPFGIQNSLTGYTLLGAYMGAPSCIDPDMSFWRLPDLLFYHNFGKFGKNRSRAAQSCI